MVGVVVGEARPAFADQLGIEGDGDGNGSHELVSPSQIDVVLHIGTLVFLATGRLLCRDGERLLAVQQVEGVGVDAHPRYLGDGVAR
ncbi:MAG: hypothetical protein BWY79_00858 [Actinobacteria bacterium ADurb.Bin444]|nr:MAG: hypothetical protein BWY79_00858 [Actinobacteria bacterium ADurb.Bin444]